MTHDRAWQQDRKLLGRWPSVWQVRKARRQLMRKWARRYSRRWGKTSWLGYCEYVARDGYYGAPWENKG